MAEPLRLGIAGLGTVGAAVARLVAQRSSELAVRCGRPVVLTAVSARERSRERGVDLSGVRWFDDAVDLARAPEIDCFVELIGGDEGPARVAVEAALSAGKSVVTANKALLAKHGMGIARMAERNGTAVGFEAAVAGGIPVIKTLRESLAANRVERIYGILNGTCNYILTRMEREGRAFDEILKDAQALGYAEADPSFDIGGHDTAHKLAILTSLAFGTEIKPDAIYVEGIETIRLEDIRAADELGYRIKLLGVALRTESGIEQRVHPTLVRRDSPIAGVNGVLNAVAVETNTLGQLMLVGPGAGGDATASSVLADICDIARGLTLPPLGRPQASLDAYRPAQMRAHEGGYYLRMSVFDQPGGFAAIAGRMAESGISLESIVQKRELAVAGGRGGIGDGSAQPVVLITHRTTEAAIRRALQAIEHDGHIDGRAQFIRIETL
jgi:homoserine dehydrogenase